MKYKSKRIYEIGTNLKRLRTELGYSIRLTGRLLGVDHSGIWKSEQVGFVEPIWARYVDIYKNHPDIRLSDQPVFDIGLVNMLDKSKIHQDLMSLYGRDSLAKELSIRTNKRVIRELKMNIRAWEWIESDIDCIRRRVGLTVDA